MSVRSPESRQLIRAPWVGALSVIVNSLDLLFFFFFFVAVPALGRDPGKSPKLGFSSWLCLVELDRATDLTFSASDHSYVK